MEKLKTCLTTIVHTSKSHVSPITNPGTLAIKLFRQAKLWWFSACVKWDLVLAMFSFDRQFVVVVGQRMRTELYQNFGGHSRVD